MANQSKLTHGQKSSSTKNGKRVVKPAISIERPEKPVLVKGEHLVFKLRTKPAEAESPTCELPIPCFNGGTPEEWLKLRKNMDEVFVGQSVTDGPGKHAGYRRILEGDTLAQFNQSASKDDRTETNQNLAKVLDEITKHIFPNQALLHQKRHMRRFLRKPQNLTTRHFVTRLNEINDYLPLFPKTADGNAPEKLPDDELLDLLEFGVPNKWQREMVRESYVPTDGTVTEFVEFCERQEILEDANGGSKQDNETKERKEKPKKGKRTRDSDDHEPKFNCMLHGLNNTHDATNCRVLAAQAKRMKATYEAQADSEKGNYRKKQENKALFEAFSTFVEDQKKAKKEAKKKKNKLSEELNKFEEFSVSAESAGSSSESPESDSE